jgi:hypothetical protein
MSLENSGMFFGLRKKGSRGRCLIYKINVRASTALLEVSWCARHLLGLEQKKVYCSLVYCVIVLVNSITVTA